MDYNSIAKKLRQYSQDLIAYKMGAEFADACNDAADAIYRLSAELERATKERCKLQELAHSQRNGLEQLRAELEEEKEHTAFYQGLVDKYEKEIVPRFWKLLHKAEGGINNAVTELHNQG